MKTLKIIAINLATFAVLLIIINWACGKYLRSHDEQNNRETLPNYKDNPEYAREIFKDYYKAKHIYAPFTGWRCLPYRGKTLTIGEDGERIAVTKMDTATGSVHFFGGSTMWGEGSDDAHTIPALFNKMNPQLKVLNHGQLAYNSRQELDALITLYSKQDEKPDVVVFYDGVNDAAFLCPKEISELPAHRLVPMYRDKINASKSDILKETVSKLFFQNILQLVYEKNQKRTPENSPYDCISTPGKAEEIAAIMMSNWEIAHDLVQQRGGRFIAILQPAAFVGNPKTDYLKLDEDLGNNFRAVYAAIKKKIAEKNHAWVYDLSDSFNGNQYIYIDFCHVSPNGNEIIAEKISNIVRKTDGAVVSNVSQ